jgi:tRNA A37 threonylcarbamoyladenosine synthetase subunit TsaC/SUA5/YrdC
MNRFIWAFAAIALALLAAVGFTILAPTAERNNNPRPAEHSDKADSVPSAEVGPHP